MLVSGHKAVLFLTVGKIRGELHKHVRARGYQHRWGVISIPVHRKHHYYAYRRDTEDSSTGGVSLAYLCTENITIMHTGERHIAAAQVGYYQHTCT